MALELKRKFGKDYGSIETVIECDMMEVKEDGSMSFSYNSNEYKKAWEHSREEALESALKVVSALTDDHYSCLIKDEDCCIVVKYTYDYDKAAEFGCATFVPLDVETYRHLCALKEEYELEKQVDNNISDLEFVEKQDEEE